MPLSMTPDAIRNRNYRVRVKANGGPLFGKRPPYGRCLICDEPIPGGYTVCSPEHGAILTAQFDAWWANGGSANVFGRYRAR
jgi:hypothetical protein